MGQDSIDTHKRREEIEAAIARGVPVRTIAEDFGLSKSAVQRHKDAMVARMAGAPAAQSTDADELLERVLELQEEAIGILAKAKRAGDHRTALAAIKEARSTTELLAKMRGELQTGTTINITVSNAWIALRADLMRALQPHPEARVAVMHALENHEPSQ